MLQLLYDGTLLVNNRRFLRHTTTNIWGRFLGGSLLSYLQTVKTFLDNNPNEGKGKPAIFCYLNLIIPTSLRVVVVTLVVTNPDAISISQYWAPTFQQSGIVPYAYVPSSSTPNGPGLNNWPTLGSLISSGKRLVVFMDYNQDLSAAPYILPEFNNMSVIFSFIEG